MNKPEFLDIRNIGQPLQRKEDDRLIKGQGRFTGDFSLPGEVWAALVRSPYPHARIVRIGKERALAMPGVMGVFTGADCAADGLGAIPHDPIPKTKYDMKLTGPGGSPIFIGPHVLLPADKARHVGEAVAIVIAQTEWQAQDAATAVEIEWEELPFVLGQDDAIMAGAPTVWSEVEGNVLVDSRFGDEAATAAAFACADHVVKMDIHIPRVTAAAMEPRAALGYCNPKNGECELYVGGGGAVRQKNEIASVLKIDPAKLRVMTFDVGGNFGAKNRV